ncbi:MAG TPA: amino acid adenylation domain-containing protein [Thermoanaerobaculia bacterium]
MMDENLEGFRLSPQQRRLWLWGAAHARVSAAIRVEGRVDEVALRTAVSRVAERHEALRTRFVVPPAAELPLQVIDPVDRADSMLTVGGGDGAWRIRVDAPAMCIDPASCTILLSDIAAEYEGRGAGEDPPQYADVAAWFNEQLDRADARHRAHWGVRRPSVPSRRSRGLTWSGVRRVHVGSALEALSRAEGVSIEAMVLACWVAAIRSTHMEGDDQVGVILDGRFPELAALVGPVEALAPVKIPELPPGGIVEAGRELDRELREAADSLNALPVDDSLPAVGFRWLPEPVEVQVDGVRFRLEDIRPDDDATEALLRAQREGEDLLLEVGCTTDHDAVGLPAPEVLAARTAALVGAVVDRPMLPMSRHPVLLESEAARARELLNPAPPATAPALVLDRVLAHALEDPDGLAVVSADGRLTNRQLAERSARVATRLLGAGVSPEDVVAIVSDASLAWFVAVVGVWRAGAACLAIDSRVPASRAIAQLQHARVRVALVARGWEMPAADVEAVVLDPDGEIEGVAGSEPAALSHPHAMSLAFVTFTSGTTGRPKGVAIEHRQLAAYAHAMAARLELPRGSRLASPAAPSVDLGATAWLVALHQGMTVAVLPASAALDAAAFAAALRELEVDLLKITPSHLSALMAAVGAGALPRRTLVLGGEQLWSDVVARIHALSPELEIFNHYGPTETTVGAVVQPIEGTPPPGQAVPIGRALPSAYALPGGDGPIPGGKMVAELWLGGPSVARGYLNDPRGTADRFLPDPGAGRPGGRAYRTGDRVRLDRSGAAVYVGRDDDQTKIRGTRVEPGEVDRELLALPGVSRAVTLAVGEGLERRLESWVAGPYGDAASILAALQKSLPEAMIPARVHRVDAIPMTAGGKPDRAALLQMLTEERPAGRPPEGAVEVAIAETFERLLRVPVDDAHKSFFELGGHSLLAMVAIARLRDALGLDVNVDAFFSEPSVAGLARVAGALRSPEGVTPVPRNGPLRASLMQERMWFWDRVTWPRSFLHNVPLSARLRGPLDVAALQSAFNALVARQDSLRTTFRLEGPTVWQRIQDHVDLPLAFVDLSSRPDPWAEYERLCLEEMCWLFDVTRTPLMRATVVRLAPDDHMLIVAIHHIVWDGWSTGLLVHELSMHYRWALGLASPVPKLPVQYADWAVWQRRYLSGDRLAYHSGFWRNELAGVRTVHLAPVVTPKNGRVGDHGVTQRYSISPDLTRALANLARKEDATLFMVLLAGLTAVLHGLSGEDDLTVGGLIANRTTSDIESVIGYFVNTVPMRSRLPHDRTFLDHLRHIRAVALAAFEHQAMPIGRVARSVADRRPQGWDQPLYSIDFMLQTAERPEPDFGDLKVQIPDFNTQTADYDMGCIMWQRTSDLARVDGLECWWEYKTDLFDERAIKTLIRRFVATLETVTREPSTLMSDLPVVDDEERAHSIIVGEGDPLLDANAPEFRAYTPPGGARPVALHRVDPSLFVTEPWDVIGLPLPGYAFYILNERGKPVAPGAAGNLFVGGEAIASGVPDPFSSRPGARMFATGERARRRHDGLVERFDAPPATARSSEIDSALARHPQIRKSLTIPVRGPDDGWRLVSYIVVAYAPSESDDAALDLQRTLAEAVRRARDGERVVVTGLRHLGLRRAFHCVEQLAAADPDAPLTPVRQRVNRAFRRDPELAVHPSFFAGIAREIPRVSAVLVQPQESVFLFDVTLHVGERGTSPPAGVAERVWADESSLSWLNALLEEQRPMLVIRGIPDTRVLAALAVERGFDETVPGARVEDMRRATMSDREAIHPDVVASLAHRHGYNVVAALDPQSPSTFAVALSRGADDPGTLLMMNIGEAENEALMNAPAAVFHRQAVVHQVREWLQPPLRPSLIIAVDDITELPCGRPNIYELPTPRQGAGRGPSDPLGKALAEIWGDATETLAVGAHERLVEDLGAHPMVAAELAAALRHHGVRAEDVLQAQTVAEMAALIRARGGHDDVR